MALNTIIDNWDLIKNGLCCGAAVLIFAGYFCKFSCLPFAFNPELQDTIITKLNGNITLSATELEFLLELLENLGRTT